MKCGPIDKGKGKFRVRARLSREVWFGSSSLATGPGGADLGNLVSAHVARQSVGGKRKGWIRNMDRTGSGLKYPQLNLYRGKKIKINIDTLRNSFATDATKASVDQGVMFHYIAVIHPSLTFKQNKNDDHFIWGAKKVNQPFSMMDS